MHEPQPHPIAPAADNFSYPTTYPQGQFSVAAPADHDYQNPALYYHPQFGYYYTTYPMPQQPAAAPNANAQNVFESYSEELRKRDEKIKKLEDEVAALKEVNRKDKQGHQRATEDLTLKSSKYKLEQDKKIEDLTDLLTAAQEAQRVLIEDYDNRLALAELEKNKLSISFNGKQEELQKLLSKTQKEIAGMKEHFKSDIAKIEEEKRQLERTLAVRINEFDQQLTGLKASKGREEENLDHFLPNPADLYDSSGNLKGPEASPYLTLEDPFELCSEDNPLGDLLHHSFSDDEDVGSHAKKTKLKHQSHEDARSAQAKLAGVGGEEPSRQPRARTAKTVASLVREDAKEEEEERQKRPRGR